MSAPWLFQSIKSAVIGHLGPDSGHLWYIDDSMCSSSTFEEHMKFIRLMFAALQPAGLTLKPSKIQFDPKEINYLGHVISEVEISVRIDRANTISNLPVPKCIKDLRSVLGMINSCFLSNKYAQVTASLVALTTKAHVTQQPFQIAWDPAQVTTFTLINRAMS